MQHLTHPFPPLYDENSRILILGSFPSVKSREVNFFYGHPQNRFWKMLAGVLNCDVPQTIEEKRGMVLAHHIAMWDAIAACEIEGSSDSSIKRAQANDFTPIFQTANIRAVFTNGQQAHKMYEKYCAKNYDVPEFCMPSTSPANAAWSLPKLIAQWHSILDFIK
uniref:DNA-deoxyinosine glycosylase n=1 Tax=uncultured Bacillota bacterium TaxID=344338 RepID=A0A650EPJ4_9FIRM|nr:DNA-deoxyinosine glycosylase [uncultured Firmicutes bacterium]